MKGCRFTKAEVAHLEDVLSFVCCDCHPEKWRKLSTSILQKLREASTTKPGVNVGPLEEALIGAARGKVVALEGGHAMASRMAANVKATPGDAAVLGGWLARQGWLNEPMTLLGVLRKWNEWLPRARATEPPPALTPGLGSDGNDGRGPASAGRPTPGRRTAPGLR